MDKHQKILSIKANMIDYKIKKYIYLYDKFDQLWTLFLINLLY